MHSLLIDNIILSYTLMTQQVVENQRVEKILLELNKTGLSYLKYLQFNQAIEFFKKAEKIVNQELIITSDNQKINQLAGVTFNNLACYYKKTKKPKVALNYLKKCLELQVYKINDWVSIGSTHLNICAIYSYLGKHEEALSHAKLAIELLDKKEFKTDDTSQEAKCYWNIKMLCYYNMAIEDEHLKIFENSLTSFKKAKEIAKIFGSKNVGIIMNCDEAISRIQTYLANLKKRMISIFMKKKQDQQTGHYQFMRHHRAISKRQNNQFSQDVLNRLSLYQSADHRKKLSHVDQKNKDKIEKAEVVQRKSNSTKFKSLHQYLNQKYKTQPSPLKQIK